MVLVLVVIIAIIAISAWMILKSGSSMKDVRQVILISIDTCRADYLSCYGYPNQATPNIDRVADEGLLFTRVYSPVPSTLPAHSSMLTGTLPVYHGVHDNLNYKLTPSSVTLAEILSGQDFKTSAIISSFIKDSQFGLDQGFDEYHDRFENPLTSHVTDERRGEETTRLALEWLDKNKNEKFFLFLHYFDPHYPYEPPEPFASRFADHLYAGEVAYTDHCIGQIMEKLKDLNLYESALLIITSDHGEMLSEHGEETHSYFIYESALKVPLIIKIPGGPEGKKIDDPVGLVDIVPTICAMLGFKAPDEIQGADLSGSLMKRQPPPEERPLYCESIGPTVYDACDLQGVIAGRWKYIRTTRPELYDLIEDPGENQNLINREPRQAGILQEQLQEILDKTVSHQDTESRMSLDGESIRRLESLGYIAGAKAEEGRAFNQNKEDPKDWVTFHTLNSKIPLLMKQKKYSEAKSICERMLGEKPGHFRTYSHLAWIAGEERDLDSAASYLAEAVRLRPDDAELREKLGLMMLRMGQMEQAVRAFEQALKLRPEGFNTQLGLGLALMGQRQYERAVTHLQKALEIKPGDVGALKNLGNILLAQGKADEAAAQYEKALEIKPDDVKLLKASGQINLRLGRIDKTLTYWKKALQLNDEQPDLLNDLAWIMVTRKDAAKGSIEEAIWLAEKACRLTEYKDPRMMNTLATAHGAAGNFPHAVKTAARALQLARASGQTELITRIQKNLDLLKSNIP